MVYLPSMFASSVTIRCILREYSAVDIRGTNRSNIKTSLSKNTFQKSSKKYDKSAFLWFETCS